MTIKPGRNSKLVFFPCCYKINCQTIRPCFIAVRSSPPTLLPKKTRVIKADYALVNRKTFLTPTDHFIGCSPASQICKCIYFLTIKKEYKQKHNW